MIKFFRKLRFSSLSRKRIPKYLLYATGEIILVVIGILIALYLNNQQQEYSIQKQQENYLRQIKGEMINNINSLQVEKQELSAQMENAYKVINVINSDSLRNSLDELEMSQMVNGLLVNDIVLPYENGALNQVIFAGGLKDIRNDSIKSQLAAWEGKVNRIRLQEEQVNQAVTKIKQYLVQYGDFRSLVDNLGYSQLLGLELSKNTKGNLLLLQSKEFENLVFEYIATGYPLETNVYERFEKEMQLLVHLIDEELDK